MMNQYATQESFVLEALEPRLLLDGNVTFAVGKDLELVGDGANNSVLIDSPAQDVIRVTGIAGTTINGGANANAGWTGGIDISMPLGHNSVEINGVTCNGKTVIELSNGNDNVYLRDFTAHGKTTIDTAGGADAVVFDHDPCTFNNKLAIVTGDGNDMVDVQFPIPSTVFNGKVSFDTGTGQDEVKLDGVIVNNKVKAMFGPGEDKLYVAKCDIKGAFSARMGKDNSTDRVEVHDTTWFSKLSLKTGGGADWIAIESDALGGLGGFRSTVKIDTGSGGDLVGINEEVVQSKFTLKLGDDQDSFVLKDTDISGAMKLDGGKGNDTYQDDGGITLVGAGTLTFKSFEVFV
jgi:hypothetical protein